MSETPASPSPTREQVRQSVAQHFRSEDAATVLGILNEYGAEPHHGERERVHLAIVTLSQGDLNEIRKLVRCAQRDYRDVLYWNERARGYPDAGADRFIETLLTPDATPARLEILTEAVPSAARVAVMWDPGHFSHATQLAALEGTARDLRVILQPVEVRRPTDFDDARATMRRGHVEAVLVLTSTMCQYHWGDIAARALAGLPAMGELRAFTAVGGLLSYGPSAVGQQERATAQMNDLSSTRRCEPAPTTPDTRSIPMELTVNLKTAAELGLTIPASVLRRADLLIQ